MKLAQGTVVGLIAGYYDVETAAGIVRTRARGVFRQKKAKTGSWRSCGNSDR